MKACRGNEIFGMMLTNVPCNWAEHVFTLYVQQRDLEAGVVFTAHGPGLGTSHV